MELTGKNIVVTGSSRGIGAGIASQLARKGAKVTVTYSSSPEKAKKVFSDLPGDGHLLEQLDINSSDSISSFFKKVLDQWGQIDGLVNNAGITRDQIMLRMKDDDFDQVIQTNLRGSFLCTKSVLKPMIKARVGSIVHITSVIGQTGNAGQANYAASKAGLEAFSKSIAKEVGSRSVRSNCVAPGFISTDMTDELDEKQKETIINNIPLQTLGTTEDIASAVCFLLSDESKYITGQTISVNGGLNM